MYTIPLIILSALSVVAFLWIAYLERKVFKLEEYNYWTKKYDEMFDEAVQRVREEDDRYYRDTR